MIQTASHATGARTSSAVRAVGLGASAGGLIVLEQFLAQSPPHSGLAYLVVQHLDPTQKAMLVELLQRSTALPVLEATDTMRLQPDAIYVIPPNKELTVARGSVAPGRAFTAARHAAAD
jgi:two-component system CheB/CheR fusion protein